MGCSDYEAGGVSADSSNASAAATHGGNDSNVTAAALLISKDLRLPAARLVSREERLRLWRHLRNSLGKRIKVSDEHEPHGHAAESIVQVSKQKTKRELLKRERKSRNDIETR